MNKAFFLRKDQIKLSSLGENTAIWVSYGVAQGWVHVYHMTRDQTSAQYYVHEPHREKTSFMRMICA